MAIDPINSTQILPGPTSTTPIGNSALGKDEFMKLLLTQMANQDPTEPQSNEEFIAQLAQFAALEASQTQAAQLDALLVAQTAANQLGAVDLVGKKVTFETDQVTLEGGAMKDPVHAVLDGPADQIVVVVKNDEGKEVAKIEIPAADLRPGEAIPIAWDGIGNDGRRVMDGTYTLQVTASRGEATEQKEAVDITVLTKAKVDGISFDEGVPMLILGDTRMLMNEVAEVWDGAE